MTDHEARGEGGRQAALIVRPTGVGQNIFERLSLQFYKLTWRTPLHSGRLRGKVPLRLITIPQDVLKGDVGRGQALRMGKFYYQGAEQPFRGVDYQKLTLPPTMTDYIHRFGWLRDLAAATNRGEGAPIAASIADDWLIANGMKTREPAWRVDNCAWRLLNMAAGSPLLLSSADPVYRSRVINHFARVARHLDQSAPRAQSHFAKSLGWAGVVAASLLLPEGKARRAVGEDGLAAALQAAIFPDGGVVSRSPVQLIELIGLLSLLKQCYNARNEMVPAFLSDAIGRAVPALLGLTHSDGGLGAWQGSAHMSAESIEALVLASEVRARPHRQALDWGYQRVSAGKTVLLLDAGPPPLARQSASGCASTLAVELSHGSQRLFVNCGGAALVGSTIPVTLARGLRTTAAHSTLCINDTNSTAILQGGQLGKGVAEVGLERRDADQATRIEASHDGYVRGFGYVHSRLLILRSDGLELRGEDTLLPKGKPKDGTPVHVRFHLGPDIEIVPTDNAQTALLRMADGSSWAFAAAGGTLSVDDSLWVDEEGRPHPTHQLVIEAATGKGGLTFSWQLRHLG
ncbi:heparinase [Sphingorhabdus sp. IMCC26285]|uniref:Heparinase n=1 Tax=Sphingorhabdus profundilacus TaxID=2509718 RepID=A0A6I4M295_9SPHN|nr:heparinase II/III family protein [Sphingorhabdus profundilacus]MVZ98306.1 heparinase [Sphingorhabdus profundilacus]